MLGEPRSQGMTQGWFPMHFLGLETMNSYAKTLEWPREHCSVLQSIDCV